MWLDYPRSFLKLNPKKNIPQISSKLDGYDLILVQEDFAYHKALTKKLHDYPFRTKKSSKGLFKLGDGLNRFANHEVEHFKRISWKKCSGYFKRSSDCMTPKGFSYAIHKTSNKLSFDMYNLHLDAGRSPKDFKAKEVQIVQLINFIKNHSSDRPIILAGDWNLRRKTPKGAEILKRLERELNVQSVCLYFNCNDETVDKFYFRSSSKISIEPLLRQFESHIFQDESGHSLSDHEPLRVDFKISTKQ